MIFAYVRVSTKEQNEEREVKAIRDYCRLNNLDLDNRNILIDKQTGKDFNRPSYQTLKNQLLREGDILVIQELDRLGRNMEMIKEEWQDLLNKGIEIIILDTPILNTNDKSSLEKTLISNIVFELLAYMAEKERLKIRDRQKQGIKSAKSRGVKFGRPRIDLDTISNKQRELIKEYYPIWRDKKITAVKFMDLLDLKTNTFYKIMKQYQETLDN